jgi:hypothetical protein
MAKGNKTRQFEIYDEYRIIPAIQITGLGFALDESLV